MPRFEFEQLDSLNFEEKKNQ